MTTSDPHRSRAMSNNLQPMSSSKILLSISLLKRRSRWGNWQGCGGGTGLALGRWVAAWHHQGGGSGRDSAGFGQTWSLRKRTVYMKYPATTNFVNDLKPFFHHHSSRPDSHRLRYSVWVWCGLSIGI